MTKAAKVYDYDTVRVPLGISGPYQRLADVSKDQIFYNVVIDKVTNPLSEEGKAQRIFLTKRGAFVADSTVKAGGGVGRGVYYWERTSKTYAVVDNALYSNGSSIQTLSTSTGTVWFCEASGASDVLVLVDGTKMYTISLSDVVTEITDADKPTSPITPVSMDGYIFVIKSGTDEIYNSDVDDPTTWIAGDFITADIFPDNLVALSRTISYVVAFGSYSTEMFYDAGNASGSPLSRNLSTSFKVGCAARDSVAATDRRCYWVGQTQTGEASVWELDGLTLKRVSNEFVEKALQNEGSNVSNITGWLCHHKGHFVYVMNLTNRTLVYDIDEKEWLDWSINSSGSHAVLPFKYMTQGPNQKILVLHSTDGKVYKLDPASYQDDAGAILTHLITTRVDMGSSQQKRMFRFELIADKESSGTCTVEWSDDDYQSWSVARSLDLTTRPFTKACGIFRRRAFRIKHESNNPFRAEAIEMDISAGVH